MKAKAIVSAFLVVSHIILMVWYYSHPIEWVVENKAFVSLVFYGFGFMIIGSLIFLTTLNAYFPIQLEIAKFHSIFIMMLGTIYALHYSGLMITNNREKLIMICAGVLLIFIIIVISAWRHGFFNKKTYDG